MAYDPSYTDCIRRRSNSASGAEPVLLQLIRVGNRYVPDSLGRSGQPALMRLYSLSKHC